MQWILGLILFSSWGMAYQATLTGHARPVGWAQTQIPLTLQTNTSDLSSIAIQSIVQSSINQWNSASAVDIYLSSSGVNNLSFRDSFSMYGSAVVGLTEVTYDPFGTILNTNIFLNDNYTFRGSSGRYLGGEIFLGDVVSHELGHFLGMSHSEVLDSTMFYSAFSGQSTISADDKAGIMAKYGGPSGTIYGYIKGGKDVGVLGANVFAISRKTGSVVGVLSGANGYFEISGLNLGDTYYLYNTPIKNLDALPEKLKNVQKTFCPGAYVGSFFSSCAKEDDGLPQGINLTTSTPSVYVGNVTISCSLKANEEYGVQKLTSTYDPVSMISTFDPITVTNFSSASPKYEQAFVGYFPTSLTGESAPDVFEVDFRNFTNLAGTNKYLKISLISQNLGTQLGYQLAVKQDGVDVPAAAKSISYSALTQTYAVDLESILPLSMIAAQNIFQLEVRGNKLTAGTMEATFPSYATFTNTNQWPYLLVVSLFENLPSGLEPLLNTQQLLSDNSACLDAPFTFAVSDAIPSDERDSSARDATVACATIEPPKNGGPGSMSLVLGIGFFMASLVTQAFKRTKKFLS